MPRAGRKGKKRQGLLSSSDVSLQDFANSTRPQSCGRIKKSVVGATGGGVMMKTSGRKLLEEKEIEELTWFEKDLEDFVIDDTVDEEREDAAVAADGDQSTRRRFKNKKKDKEKDDALSYPFDLWFLLAKFVDPEDIKSFALICQGSYAVTKTVAFWRKLYERKYYSKKEDQILPCHLKPTSLERIHGLRARVIRSLFYLHAPFVSRFQSRGPLDDEPHALKGYRCLLSWHQPGPKGWQFCFKFQRPSFLSKRTSTKQNLYYGYNDLFYNPENGCCLLQVTCCHFASVSPVMGLLLKQVYMTLSTGFRHHRLRLHFDSSIAARDSALADTVVTLDDIIAVKLLDWWHPMYPFNT